MQIEEDISLAPWTTLKIGGKARFLTTVRSEPDLLEAVGFARQHGLPAWILGGGSNLVVPDDTYPGLVVRIAPNCSIVRRNGRKAIYFEVSAGTSWDALVLAVCEQGVSGMECLAGIPGLVGGAPIQNIGAYGQEVSQTIDAVRALDRMTMRFVELSREACRFSYRTSVFNSEERGRYIVTSVRFRLEPEAKPNLNYADLAPLRGSDPTALDVYHAVRRIRDGKGMLIDSAELRPESRSAGSFFKNPVIAQLVLTSIEASSLVPDQVPHWPLPSGEVKLPAAWLIERAGFPKGFTLTPDAPVGISPRHTLALINRSGTATFADLMELRDHIVAAVQERFGVHLEQEPVMLGRL